jgi:pre-mRNA-processing factor SLU7
VRPGRLAQYDPLIMHADANPTQAAMVHKEFLAKKQELKGKSAHSMLEKYGGKEHLQKLPKELLAGQSEDYVGALPSRMCTLALLSRAQNTRGPARSSKVRSEPRPRASTTRTSTPATTPRVRRRLMVSPRRTLTCTAVWGSYYKNGSWGYACCHAFMRAAYCAGQAGIEAEREEAAGRLLTGRASTSAAPIEDDRSRSLMDQHDPKGKRKAIEGAGDDEPATKRRYGEGDVDKRLDGEKCVPPSFAAANCAHDLVAGCAPPWRPSASGSSAARATTRARASTRSSTRR